MTLDQIDQMLRQANPVPDLTALEPVEAPDLLLDRRRVDMETKQQVEVEPEAEKSRWGLILGIAAAVMVVIGALILFQLREAPVIDKTEETVPPSQDLGVFEPIRGWIVYNVAGSSLKAIDPVNPSIQRTLEFPNQDGASRLMAAGWSRDGSHLAVDSEHSGGMWVMDRLGAVKSIPTERLEIQRGCCWFVTSHWLSPDGSAAAIAQAGGLDVLDLDDMVIRRLLEVDEADESEYLVSPVWSPDGSEIAVVHYREAGNFVEPTVEVVDVEGGAARQLVGPEFGHIRQISWSPDGSQLLLIAGDDRLPSRSVASNPLLSPNATGIFLVNADGSDLREIETGPPARRYHVAAAWSPDGNQIAVRDYGLVARQIVVMNIDGTGQRILAYADAFASVAWHPAP